MKFSVLFSLLSLTSADIISPVCINNYSTFLDQIMSESRADIIISLNNTDSIKCSTQCNLNSNCTSFNYYPKFLNNWKSRCVLLASDFNSSNLVKSFNNEYYIKSPNDCSSSNYLIIVLYICISLIGLSLICCLGCYCSKRRRGRGYHHIN